MIEEERIFSGQVEPEEVLVDNNLRPRKLGQYIGQELVKRCSSYVDFGNISVDRQDRWVDYDVILSKRPVFEKGCGRS